MQQLTIAMDNIDDNADALCTLPGKKILPFPTFRGDMQKKTPLSQARRNNQQETRGKNKGRHLLQHGRCQLFFIQYLPQVSIQENPDKDLHK
jgi:hypothetical protein